MTEQLPVETIAPNPRNPREVFGEAGLDQLAQTIERQGLLNPVVVRPHPSSESEADGESPDDDSESASDSEFEYEMVTGERRLRAVQRLGWETIEATVRDLTDEQALELTITENLQREDVSAIEEARGYEQLIEEHDLTQAEAADRLGVSRSHISNQLGLLNMPVQLQDCVLHKTLSPWQARTLASVWDDWYLLDLVWDHDLSVEALREIITDLQETEDGPIRVPASVSPAAIQDAVVSPDEMRELGFDDEEIENIRLRDSAEFTVWASEQPELDYPEPPSDWEIEVHPAIYHVGHGIIYGGMRVERAIETGYEGEIDVETWYPRQLFATERFDEIKGGDDGEGGSGEGNIDASA